MTFWTSTLGMRPKWHYGSVHAGGHENAQWRGHQAGDAGGNVRVNGVAPAAERCV